MRHVFAFLVACLITLPALAAPPTVSRETTYYLGPIDDEGYVDYVAALNAAFGDADAKPDDNAFVGILQHYDTSDWIENHAERLFAVLGVPAPDPGTDRFAYFLSYGEAKGLPQAEPFDWENAPEGAEPPPPASGTIDAMLDRASSEPWTDDELPHVAAWLDESQASLDAIAAAIQRPSYYVPLIRPHERATMIEVLLPHLGAHRQIGRSLNMRARRHLGHGRIDAAIDDWAAIARLGRLQTRESTLISNLVGISLNAMSHDLLQVILRQPGFIAAHLQAIERARSALPEGPSMSRVIREGERISVLDMLTRASRRDVRVLEMIGMMQSVSFKPEPAVYFVSDRDIDAMTELIADPRFDLDRALRRVNALWAEWFGEVPDFFAEQSKHIDRVEQSLVERSEQSPQLAMMLMLAGRTGLTEASDTDLLADQTADLLLNILTPALSAALITERQSRTQFELGGVAVALARYRADRGAFPESLDALTPRYLTAVPRDPFAENQPLRYRRDQPHTYTLYSVNRNGEDNGGFDDLREGDIVVHMDLSSP